MSWNYEQSTGKMTAPDGDLLAFGYSGHWDGSEPEGNVYDHRNRSADQHLIALGPIPVGTYTIGDAFDDPGGKGPVVMHLIPDPANQMFGRSGFMCHGDSVSHPGQASEGCICINRTARQIIADSADRTLVVS